MRFPNLCRDLPSVCRIFRSASPGAANGRIAVSVAFPRKKVQKPQPKPCCRTGRFPPSNLVTLTGLKQDAGHNLMKARQPIEGGAANTIRCQRASRPAGPNHARCALFHRTRSHAELLALIRPPICDRLPGDRDYTRDAPAGPDLPLFWRGRSYQKTGTISFCLPVAAR